MSAQPSAMGAKVCVMCGTDVSKLPRVKDAAGRYLCQGACEQTAKERAAAAWAKRSAPKTAARPVAATNDMAMMDQLLSSSPVANAKACPGCGQLIESGAVVCLGCGYNTQTQRAQGTRVAVDKAPKAPKPIAGKRGHRYATQSAGPSFWKALLVTTLVMGGIGLLPIVGQTGFVVAIILLFIAGLVAWIGGTVAAFRNEQTMWGICGVVMILPFVNIVGGIGFLIYNLLFNQDAISRALYWANFIGWIMFGVGTAIGVAIGHQFELFGTPLGGSNP